MRLKTVAGFLTGLLLVFYAAAANEYIHSAYPIGIKGNNHGEHLVFGHDGMDPYMNVSSGFRYILYSQSGSDASGTTPQIQFNIRNDQAAQMSTWIRGITNDSGGWELMARDANDVAANRLRNVVELWNTGPEGTSNGIAFFHDNSFGSYLNIRSIGDATNDTIISAMSDRAGTAGLILNASGDIRISPEDLNGEGFTFTTGANTRPEISVTDNSHIFTIQDYLEPVSRVQYFLRGDEPYWRFYDNGGEYGGFSKKNSTNGDFFRLETNGGRIILDPADGVVDPGTDDADDLGSSAYSWDKLYVNSILNDGNIAITPTGAVDITGEISVSGVSGSGKIVCVKADGDFGVCSDDPSSADGTCTCG